MKNFMLPFLQRENGGNRIDEIGTFMVVQWLRLQCLQCRRPGFHPSSGNRACMSQLKILQASTKRFCMPQGRLKIPSVEGCNYDPTQPNKYYKNKSSLGTLLEVGEAWQSLLYLNRALDAGNFSKSTRTLFPMPQFFWDNLMQKYYCLLFSTTVLPLLTTNSLILWPLFVDCSLYCVTVNKHWKGVGNEYIHRRPTKGYNIT